MTTSYKQLQAFVHVAQSNTFAEAAELMHITQPALSVSVKKLEIELGGSLFARTTRTVELTPEGKRFYTEAKRLLAQWDTAILDMQNLFAMQKGTLSIACMPSFAESYLPEVLQEFHRDYPNVSIRVRDEVMEDAIESVVTGRCELGFVFEPTRLEGLEYYPLFNNGFVVIMSGDHALNRHNKLTWEDIINTPHVTMHKGTSVRTWIDAALPQDKALNIVAEASQLSTVGQLVASNLGIAIVPELCTKQMQQIGVTCVTFLEPKLNKSVGIIRSLRRELAITSQSMLRQCEERLKQAL